LSKQRLGERKERLCSEIGGKEYRACYTRGSREHFLAECWFGDGEKLQDCDWVNYKTREVSPRIRAGQVVEREPEPQPEPPIFDFMRTVTRDAFEAGGDYMIVPDAIFDEYEAGITITGRFLQRLAPADAPKPEYEYLMFKAIRIYPERAGYHA
jgi:hypothetical protein